MASRRAYSSPWFKSCESGRTNARFTSARSGPAVIFSTASNAVSEKLASVPGSFITAMIGPIAAPACGPIWPRILVASWSRFFAAAISCGIAAAAAGPRLSSASAASRRAYSKSSWSWR